MRIEPLARACVLATTLIFAACGSDPAPPASPTSAPTQAPTEAPTTADPAATATAPPPSSDGSSPAINSVTVDPGDGTIMVGSGPALFRLAPGAKEAERLTGQVPGGTVSGNLVVRFAGPNDLLASGHPQEGNLPENLGLIRSKDHGDTWERVQGPEADYHELEIAGKLILGVNAESPDIQVSSDGGASWETRTPPAAPIDVVVNPGDPAAVGGLDRAGHLRLRQRWAVLAPARHDVRRTPDLAEQGRALQRRSQRQAARQRGRRALLEGPRRHRRPAQRGHRRPAGRDPRRRGRGQDPPVQGRRAHVVDPDHFALTP